MTATDGTRRTLATDWVLWVVENLAEGASPDDVVTGLVDAGVARDDAEAAVTRVVRSPTFARMNATRVRGEMAERVLRAWPHPFDAIERVEALDHDTFYWQHFAPMRPVVITQQLRAMRAFEAWSFASLRERLGDRRIEVTSSRTRAARPAEIESRSERVSFAEILDHAAHGEGNERYLVARNGLLLEPGFRDLRADLAPLPPYLVTGRDDASWASLWIGPHGTRTPLHFDPHAAVLFQVRGRKRVRLIPPTETWLYELSDGCFARHDLASGRPQSHPEFRASRVLDVVVEEGEAIFLPALWWHEVDALSPSITVTMLSLAWPNDFHAALPHAHRPSMYEAIR